MSEAVIDSWPATATLRAVQGDPFAYRLLVLDEDDNPVDTSQWEWRSTVASSSIRLDFEIRPDDEGVWLWLRGDDTARLGTMVPYQFDVACRQPEAGEGMTVLRGMMFIQSRTTDVLRSDPDLRPGREEDLVPK